MPAAAEGHPPFLPGQYMAPPTLLATTEAQLIGTEVEGKEFWFLDYNWAASGTVKPLRSNIPRKLRVVRNVSGFNILPKRLVVLGLDGAANSTTSFYGASSTYTAIQPTSGPLVYSRTGYHARNNTLNTYPVDEFLPSTGVPHGGLYYIVIEGPATCINDGAATTIATGDWLYGCATVTTAAATNASSTVAGRLTTAFAAAASTTIPNVTWLNLLGRSLSTTATTGADVLVNVRKVYDC